MKTILFAVVCAVFMFPYECHLFAQVSSGDTRYIAREISLQDDSTMLTGNRYMPSLSVYIPETEAMDIRKAWEKKIKKGTKSKVTQYNNVFLLSQTVLEEISLIPLNVYTSYTQQNKDTKLTVAFELDREFLSPSFMPDNYANARSLLKAFGLQQYKESAENTLNQEKRTLRQMKQQLDKLFDENKQLEALIKKRERGISTFEIAVKEHNTLIDMKTQNIVESTEALKNYTGELREQRDKELKSIYSERKQLQRKAKKMAKDIARYKVDIRQAEHTIKLNLSKQKQQRERVNEQQQVVEQLKNVKNKLDDM